MYQVGEIEFFGTEGGSLFQIVTMLPSSDLTFVDMEFTSFEGRFYSIDRSRDLETWIELEDGLEGEADVTEYTDVFPPPNDGDPVYYRVRQQ